MKTGFKTYCGFILCSLVLLLLTAAFYPYDIFSNHQTGFSFPLFAMIAIIISCAVLFSTKLRHCLKECGLEWNFFGGLAFFILLNCLGVVVNYLTNRYFFESGGTFIASAYKSTYTVSFIILISVLEWLCFLRNPSHDNHDPH